MEFRIEEIEKAFTGEIINKISDNKYLIKIQDKDHNLEILNMDSNGMEFVLDAQFHSCLLYTSPSPRDGLLSRMPSSA